MNATELNGRIAALEDRFHLLVAVLARRGTLTNDELVELRLAQSASTRTNVNTKARSAAR